MTAKQHDQFKRVASKLNQSREELAARRAEQREARAVDDRPSPWRSVLVRKGKK